MGKVISWKNKKYYDEKDVMCFYIFDIIESNEEFEDVFSDYFPYKICLTRVTRKTELLICEWAKNQTDTGRV